MDDVEVYSSGITRCSVCTSLTDKKEIVKRVNELHPTGIKSKWEISEEKTFKGGQPNPCPCEGVPGRMHYLMVC